MKKHLIIFFAFASFAGCISQNSARNQLPESQLLFGKGGGFTGATTTYVLNESGLVLKHNTYSKEQKTIKTIAKKRCKEVFEEAEKASLQTLDINQPGNIYYFIEIRDNQDTNRIVWGSPNYQVPQNIQLLYTQLIDITKP